ncbi:hypothetical protein [uncultured Clostridium sp.]|uniref:hypothetical protein n=1 Tax=uncultured Clostridium sp. TaxID=59620 RepID=UPI00272DEA03|nr:hypothetical protein [uncultured Clostridium sp.]
MKTTKSDIEKILWKACDSFRGKIDSKINAADVNTVEYETIKNSIKKSITSKILNLNEL